MDLPCNPHSQHDPTLPASQCILCSSLDSTRFALYLSVMTDATDKTDIDKDIDGWEIAADRHYTLTSTTSTRRLLRQHERCTNYKGELITVSWSRECLENVRNALLFISQNITHSRSKVPRFFN